MDYGTYLQFFLTLIFIIGLIFAAAFLAKKLGFSHSPTLKGNRKRRLQVIELRSIDTRRKIVLIKCDDKEHLLLVGGSQDIHIDSIHPALSDSENNA